LKKSSVPIKTRRQVVSRAGNKCEYCLLPAEASIVSLQVDHIIPELQQGPTVLENLALACKSCNVYKGYSVVKYYYESGKTVLLFNPRKELWKEHFSLQETGIIASLSETGAATVDILRLNEKIRVEGRLVLISQGIIDKS
jgi:hypothetical protein